MPFGGWDRVEVAAKGALGKGCGLRDVARSPDDGLAPGADDRDRARLRKTACVAANHQMTAFRWRAGSGPADLA